MNTTIFGKWKLAFSAAIFFCTLISISGETNADVIGDDYTIGLTGFNSDFTAGLFVNGGVITETFLGDGVIREIAASGFGNAGDTMNLLETHTVNPDGTREAVITVFAADAGGNLTNWFADGSDTGSGPFQTLFLDLGDFNGGADKLNPLTTSIDGVTDGYRLDSSSFFFLGTGGGLFGPGGSPFDWDNTSDSTGISGSAGVNLGGDAATQTFGGQEFAGFEVTFVYAAIPEPGALVFLLFGSVAFTAKRRNRLA